MVMRSFASNEMMEIDGDLKIGLVPILREGQAVKGFQDAKAGWTLVNGHRHGKCDSSGRSIHRRMNGLLGEVPNST